MIKKRIAHHDLGVEHLDPRCRQAKAKRLLAQLGYQVQLQPAAGTRLTTARNHLVSC